jgi:myb proto-oncogene protein
MNPDDASPGKTYGKLKGFRRFFTPDDDIELCNLKRTLPNEPWTLLVQRMPGFNLRQLRERWCNYLCPKLKTTPWTAEEDRQLMQLYETIGCHWGIIGAHMGGRAAPDIKNRFQSLRNRMRCKPPVLSHAHTGTQEQQLREGSAPPKEMQNHKAQKEDALEKPPDFSIKSILI